jgi:hypothetical protein
MVSLTSPARAPRFKIELQPRNTPEKVLLQDLRRVSRQTGDRSPSTTTYDAHGNFSAQALGQRFGSWNGALRAAGLPIRKPRKISDADLFDNLVQLWRLHGRQPVCTDLVRKVGGSRYSSTPYYARFGSWNKALQAFDDYINRGKPPKQRVAVRKKTARNALGRTINWRLRATVLIRDNCICRMCGASPAKDPAVTLHVDHVVPWARGGTTTLDNLQTLCSACNVGKGDQPCERGTSNTSKACTGKPRRSLPRRRR